MSSAPENVQTPDVSDASLPVQSDFAGLKVTRKIHRNRSKMRNRIEATQLEDSLPALPDALGVPSTSQAGTSIQRKRSATMMTETHLTTPRPTKMQRDSTEATEDEDDITAKGKAPRRGKRSGQRVKASQEQARTKKSELTKAKAARNIIRMLDALEQPISETPEDQLTNEEAIKIATGHGVNKGRKEIAVDTTREGERWRDRHNIKIDQFKDSILSDKQIRELKFRLFTHGAVWGYRKNSEGKYELVFSVIFHFFDQMSESELDDFAFMGGFFASLQDGPKLDTNKYMDGGTMFGLGWRGGTDREFRLGWYARHPNTDWAKHHKDECRLAAIYNRIFLQQSRYIHGLATETINRLRLPRLSDQQLGEGKSELPAANLTCTCQDFRNKMHRDHDASDWTFGLWFPTYANGKLVRDAEEEWGSTSANAQELSQFCGKDRTSFTGLSSQKLIQNIVAGGTSIQCTKRLTERIERHAAMLEGKLGKDRQPIPALKINDYYARSSMPRPAAKYRWWVDDMYHEEGDNGQDTDSDVDDQGAEVGYPDGDMWMLLSEDQHSSDSDYETDGESDYSEDSFQ
ncbi:hypothetical protein RhiJN_00518 [Ceratobasidium sp. AG-Ba]|nr:hypothetical protein RhiJN_00518 [Ceratobasidium sp. AG-Ba]QRW01550.1 hypothetical protein RhiLY_00547 [Ceratobasidium sp. AG-Ba]